jgi:preprotein translocase subunit YajC
MTSLFIMFQGGLGNLGPLLPFVLVIGIFYVLVFMPQRKRQKQMAEMVAALKTGDKVVTNSGIIGTITSLKDDSLMLRTGSVNIEVLRSAVASMQTDAASVDVKGSVK